MNLDEVKSDEVTVLTKEMQKLFRANGCDPTCHCCGIKISVGDSYKLGHVSEEVATKANLLKGFNIFKTDKEHDVMLCGNERCTPFNMVKNHVAKVRRYEQQGLTAYGNSYRSGGCSIIDGRIVP